MSFGTSAGSGLSSYGFDTTSSANLFNQTKQKKTVMKKSIDFENEVTTLLKKMNIKVPVVIGSTDDVFYEQTGVFVETAAFNLPAKRAANFEVEFEAMFSISKEYKDYKSYKNLYSSPAHSASVGDIDKKGNCQIVISFHLSY